MLSEPPSERARRTAKGGILAEQDVVAKFNNWKSDPKAQEWLKTMNYDLDLIEAVEAEGVGGKSEKADVAVHINVRIKKKTKNGKSFAGSVENIQVKKVSNKRGSNQMERKQVDKYIIPWHIPSDVARILKLFTGAIPPDRPGTISPDRMYIDEFTESERERLRDFLLDNMVMIISDIVRGRGRYAVEWMLVIQDYTDSNGTAYSEDMLLSINETINYYVGNHTVSFPPQTKDGKKCGIKIGRVTMQRKGGDGPTDLQFKSDPSKLFEIKKLMIQNME